MAIEQIVLNLFVGLGVGAIASFIAKLGTDESFNVKKFIYSISIGAISGLTVIQGLENGNVTEQNLITVILLIFGASFVGNKSIGALQKLNSKKTS